MRSILFSLALFGVVCVTSNQVRLEASAITSAPTSSQAAPHAVPFLLYSVATGALLACGTAAAIAGIVREEA
jgi:hypothetical protein